MRLRLWLNWQARSGNAVGYHLELDRPYDRTPVKGEIVDMPLTSYGLAHMSIEDVLWDDEGANLLLGVREEAEGNELAEYTQMGFHSGTADLRDGCRYCELRQQRSDHGGQ